MSQRMQYSINGNEGQVLTILTETAAHHDKHYCYPSQKFILKSLRLRFGRTISRRTLCRYTGSLEAKGFIRRTQRHKRNKDGSLELHSTMYHFCRNAVQMLESGYRKVANFLGFNAVTGMAHNKHHTVVSQPQKPAKSARASSAVMEEGIQQLKDILQT